MLGSKQGAKILTAIDLEQYRLKKSLEFGASHSINPSNEDMLSISEEITKGEGYDVVVDASGDPNGINHCIDLVKEEGQIISFSLIRGGKTTLEYQKFLSKNLNIVSTVVAATNDNQATMEFLKFLLHPEPNEWWMAKGGFLTPNKNADLAKYSSDTFRKLDKR